MTQLIAAWARPGHDLDPGVCAKLEGALGPAGQLQVSSGRRHAVVSWDSQIWPGPSVSHADGRSVVVAGDPVVTLGDRTLDRPQAVEHLRDRLLDSPDVASGQAEGSHATLAWNTSGAMVATTDKLGVRAVYWACVGDVVYVSTVMWALERLPGVSDQPDLRGAVEACAFGAPLADRTLRVGVHALGAGEYLDLTGHAPAVRRYHDWAALPPNGVPLADLPAYIDEAFDRAVAARLYGQRRVFAFLSGGMDSRLVVARLRARDLQVCAMNFAPPGSQDLLFGRMAAQGCGVDLFEFDDEGTEFLSRRSRAFDAWRAVPEHRDILPPQDRLVWSGDGGSVALGHVYLNEAIVAAARSEGVEAAALAIQRANRYEVSERSFGRSYRDLARLPLEGIKQDLLSRNGVEPGRNAHLFFMLNDQRRHLSIYYESLHEHRLDLVVPFFDGRFLKAVLSSAVDPFLLHRLYNKLMARQPFGLGKIPWQVYPGHEACPVPAPELARLQWKEGWFDAGLEGRSARARMRRHLRFVLSSKFPATVLSRPMLLAAAAAGSLGLHRYGYLLKPIGPVCHATGVNRPL